MVLVVCALSRGIRLFLRCDHLHVSNSLKLSMAELGRNKVMGQDGQLIGKMLVEVEWRCFATITLKKPHFETLKFHFSAIYLMQVSVQQLEKLC